MTQLKTLKDFDFSDLAFGEYGSACLVKDDEIKNNLRNEAIKWIKHYRDMNEKDKRIADDDRDVRGVKLGANYLIQEWIKQFFNIREEDLQ